MSVVVKIVKLMCITLMHINPISFQNINRSGGIAMFEGGYIFLSEICQLFWYANELDQPPLADRLHTNFVFVHVNVDVFCVELNAKQTFQMLFWDFFFNLMKLHLWKLVIVWVFVSITVGKLVCCCHSGDFASPSSLSLWVVPFSWRTSFRELMVS